MLPPLITCQKLPAEIARGDGLFRIGSAGCLVETTAWEAKIDLAAPDARQNRPSSHKPVSAVIEWDE